MEKKKARRRRKYCPECKEIIFMSVVREAQDESDLYWLKCPQCENHYALTSQQFHRKKRPKISAIEEPEARIYRTNQTYSIGDTIYHSSLHDLGVVVEKAPAPTNDCSGAIVVSFLREGQKNLIEGYTPT